MLSYLPLASPALPSPPLASVTPRVLASPCISCTNVSKSEMDSSMLMKRALAPNSSPRLWICAYSGQAGVNATKAAAGPCQGGSRPAVGRVGRGEADLLADLEELLNGEALVLEEALNQAVQ